MRVWTPCLSLVDSMVRDEQQLALVTFGPILVFASAETAQAKQLLVEIKRFISRSREQSEKVDAAGFLLHAETFLAFHHGRFIICAVASPR